MADQEIKERLKNMVKRFRVLELQQLLRFARQDPKGRKPALVDRVLSLIDQGVSLPIQLQIQKLHRKLCPHLDNCALSLSLSHTSLSGNNGVPSGPSQMPAQQTSGGSGRGNSGSGSGKISGTGSSQMLQHPDVKLKSLPFYDQRDEILKPFALVPCTPAQLQEMQVNFQLSKQQQLEILMSGFTVNSPYKLEYSVQIQLRFCLYGSSHQQPDCFPPGLGVKVNGWTAQLPNLIPAKVLRTEPKRSNGPIDITMLRKRDEGTQCIDISWSTDQQKQYCAALYLTKKLDSNVLLTRLQQSGTSKPARTKQMIKEKLSLDRDSEILTTSLCVSLLCPIGKVRMTVPCRGGLCDHLQCFDALTYLRLNEQKSSWMCPVCDRPTEYDQLIIDGLFSEIIADSPNATEIELTKDGQWRITKGGEVDDNAPCQSHKPDKPIAGSSGCNDISIIDLTETDGIDLPMSESKSESTAPSFSSAISAANALLDSPDSPPSSCPPRSDSDIFAGAVPLPLPPSFSLECSTVSSTSFDIHSCKTM